MSSPAPEPEVVAQYGRAAPQNARGLIADSKALLGLQRRPRVCSLAILATEEASKAITRTIMPMLPPEQAREFFAWPFADINRTHGLKLGMARIVSHMMAFFTGALGPAARYSPTLESTEANARAENDLKQRGFYVTFRDERIMCPIELGEEDARTALDRAKMLANVAGDILDWSEHLPEELLADRAAQWDAITGAFARGGY